MRMKLFMLRLVALSAVCAGAGLTTSQEIALSLGPELCRRLEADYVPLLLGDGISVEAIDGRQAVSFGAAGVTARTALPQASWSGDEGTVEFWLRTSRRIGHVDRDDESLSVALVSCPAFRLELQQHLDCPWFVAYPDSDASKPRAVCRISYLLPDRWYHIAVTWQRSTGAVDVFVNGWAQQRIGLDPWGDPGEEGDVPLELGVVSQRSVDASFVAIAAPRLYAWSMDEAQLRSVVANQDFGDVGWGVRKRRSKPMDLSGYRLERVYQADFVNPLSLVREDSLFDGDDRTRVPKEGQWVLEGNAEVTTAEGRLLIDNLDTESANHVVLWLPRPFPEDMLLEFEIRPEVPDRGLAIVFFAARPRDDPAGSIFDVGLAKREGNFRRYIRGDINSYHVSYIAAGQITSTIPGPRRTANIRKNSGFWLVACGDDQIYGKGYGRRWHQVRILKVGGNIRIEANGRMSAALDDHGETWGPVWGDGYIGLRQMNHLLSAEYRGLSVYRVTMD